jgi:hypothetical protein
VGDLGLFGGSISPYSNIVEIYNGSSHQWSVAYLSVPRGLLAATSVRDVALFAGGNQGAGGYLSTVDIFNATSNQWTTANLSLARSDLAATTVGDLALFAGGENSPTVPFVDTVDIYDAASNTWNVDHLSVPRISMGAASLRDAAFFGGGYNGSALDIVDIFNATTGNWSVTHLSLARYALSATALGNRVFFVGGFDPDTFNSSSVIDVYDVDQQTWLYSMGGGPSLSVPRMATGITVLRDIILFAGGNYYGGGSGFVSLPTVDIYNSTSDSWSVSTLMSARSGIAAFSVNDIAFFAVGSVSDTTTRIVEVFQFTTDAIAQPSIPINGISACPTSSPIL